MPLFKSLRSKSSRKSTASESSVVDANNNSTDFGPRSPSSTTHGSIRSNKKGIAANLQSNSVSSMDKMNMGRSSVPSSPTRYRASSYFREEGVNNGAGPTLMQTVSEMGNGNSTAIPSAPPVEPEIPKPRPSELFAGKGVQWQSVKLAGPPPSPSSLPKSNTNEDLQNFLKMRRQWKPTFAEHDSPERRSHVPRDLSQLTFSSQDDNQTQGLMSFKDLDESHQRKQKLMNSPPIGGSLFDEPESSKAASNRPIVERGSSLPKNAKPEATRKVSSKSSKSARKLFGGAKGSEMPAESMPVSSSAGGKGGELDGLRSSEEASSNVIAKSAPEVPPSRAPPPIQSALPDQLTQSKSGQNLEEGISDEGDQTLLAGEDGKLVTTKAIASEADKPSATSAIPGVTNGSAVVPPSLQNDVKAT